MSIGLLFLMAGASVVAALVFLIRTVGLKFVLRHSTLIDIVFTVAVCITLAGTITGLLIGIIAGLLMTGLLTVAKGLSKLGDKVQSKRPVTFERDGDGWSPKYGWGEL